MAQNRPDEPLDLNKILEETFKDMAFAPQKTAAAPQNAPQKTAVAPQKTAVAPQKTSGTTQKTAVAPQKTAAAPQKTAVAPQKTATAPQKTAIAPQKTAASPTADSIFGPMAVKSGNSQSAAGDTIKAGNKSYTVKKLLGSGAEGDIYVVADSKRLYALKKYHHGFGPNKKILPGLKKLNGKGYIADIIDYGDDFELMEYIPEGSAAEAGIKGNAAAILAVAVKTAMSLDKLHGNGILHKDIKPANILIRSKSDWDSVLCDFGIADELDRDGKCATLQVRTPIYAAPEVYTDTITIDNATYIELGPKADFYSLGMSILSLWMGESAFLSKESQMAIDKVKGRITVPAEMPDPLARICRGLLIKNPAKRWDWPEIERTLNGETVEVEEDTIIEDLNITFSASKHLVANTPEELAQCMMQDKDLAIKYLYRGQVEKWLKPYPELVLEMQEIVEKRYPKDQNTGVMAAIYALDPAMPFELSGGSRETGERVEFSALTLKDIGNFCNKALPYTECQEAISSDIFREWVRSRSKDVAAKLPPSDSEITTYMLRVQTVDPMSDINLVNDPANEWYAMTQDSIGRLFNVIYWIWWCQYRGSSDELLKSWMDEENAPLNRQIPLQTILYVAFSFEDPDSCSYVKDFFSTKGLRFQQQKSWFEYCTDYEDDEYLFKAGPKDDRYNAQTAWMKVIKGFGCTPEYWFPDSEKSAGSLAEAFSHKKKELKEEYENGGLDGWLAVQHHEDPDADLTPQFAYEKRLHDYIEDIRRIDPGNEYVSRFDQAGKEAGDLISSGKAKVRRLSTRNMLQHLFTLLFAVLPAIILVVMLVLAIIENPVIDTGGLKLEKFFWPIGLIGAAVIFFAADTDGCIVPIIGGAVCTAVLFFVIKLLGAFILYIFLALVLTVLIFFSIKTLFSRSVYAASARKFTKPGFDEQVLEPLYYAFSDEKKFDSSLNAAFNDDDIARWKEDLKKRRRYVLLYIASVWLLSVFSIFVPTSEGFSKLASPVVDKVLSTTDKVLSTTEKVLSAEENRENGEAATTSGSKTPATEGNTTTAVRIKANILRPGDSGEDVVAMQKLLKAKGYFSGTVDGDYGEKTKAAIRAFQKDNEMKATGLADKATIRKLNGSPR